MLEREGGELGGEEGIDLGIEGVREASSIVPSLLGEGMEIVMNRHG